ncbi:hypothetical protein HK101_000537 [Irineochytrium annulatum]|nr:hypothetical protein HK101_000537 [Irineochytrium annulatum]
MSSPSPSLPATKKQPTWSKGSNAKFHFVTYAYVSPEIDSAADEEIEKLKKEHAEGHPNGKDGKGAAHAHGHGHGPGKGNAQRGEALRERADMLESMIAQLSTTAKKPQTKSAARKDAGAANEVERKEEAKTAEAEAPKAKKVERGPPQRKKIGDSRDADPTKPFEMRVGLGFSVPCIEKCVKTMKVGEKAKFLCMPEECEGYAQLESVLRQEKKNRELAAKGLPPQRMGGCCAHANTEDAAANKDLLLLVSSPLEVEIELVSVQEPGDFTREIWEMSSADKLAEAPLRKEEGTRCYKAGDIAGATEKYTRALMLLESLSMSPAVTDVQRSRAREVEMREKEVRRRADERRRLERLGQPVPEELLKPVPELSFGNETSATGDKVVVPLAPGEIDPEFVLDMMKSTRLNYAACKLKLGELPTVVVQCSEVLKGDPSCVKALFRRAQAYLRLGRDLDLAEKDLLRLKEVFQRQGIAETAGEWLELKKEEKNLDRLMKANHAKEKKMFANMFA